MTDINQQQPQNYRLLTGTHEIHKKIVPQSNNGTPVKS